MISNSAKCNSVNNIKEYNCSDLMEQVTKGTFECDVQLGFIRMSNKADVLIHKPLNIYCRKMGNHLHFDDSFTCRIVK